MSQTYFLHGSQRGTSPATAAGLEGNPVQAGPRDREVQGTEGWEMQSPNALALIPLQILEGTDIEEEDVEYPGWEATEWWQTERVMSHEEAISSTWVSIDRLNKEVAGLQTLLEELSIEIQQYREAEATNQLNFRQTVQSYREHQKR